MLNKYMILSLLMASIGVPCSAQQTLDFTVLAQKPHDKQSFTQGLELKNGLMIESSGLYRRSYVRVYDEASGDVKRQQSLPDSVFAEGLTVKGNDIYLLSWRRQTLFILDFDTLKTKKTLAYQGEGWGICHDEAFFYTSNGTATISVRDMSSFEVRKTMTIKNDTGEFIDQINELECVKGVIWANRWQHKQIYRIDTESGKVTGTVDLSQLVPFYYRNSDSAVLNGIAYDKAQDAFWVTGKNWNVRYLIQVTEKPTQKNQNKT